VNRRHIAAAAVFATVLLVGAALSAQKQDDAADTARLIVVLAIRTGDTVADIGAGDGVLTVPIARHVGAAGRVYATDINPQRLLEIRSAVGQAKLQNVVVLEGGSTRTNLPEGCCDAVFMRHVYHHFGDPPVMNASLMESLKAGGRLAVVDFPPDNGVSAQAGRRSAGTSHGVMPQTVIDELRAAGFVGVEQLPWPSKGYFLIVARRPD
jgi:ubiquinone/menaquinone biosynthesis C-methylase UbiE